jgi:hypothetical protein
MLPPTTAIATSNSVAITGATPLLGKFFKPRLLFFFNS